MSKLSEEEIEQIARIVAAATQQQPGAAASGGKLRRAGLFFLTHWPLTVLLLSAVGLLGAIVYEGASPLYYFKKMAAEDRDTTAKLAMHEYREDLSKRHLELGYLLLDQGLQDDALTEFKAAREFSENSIAAALAIRTAELFDADALDQYNPAVFKTRVLSLFREEVTAERQSRSPNGPSAELQVPPEDRITNPHVLAYLADFYRLSGNGASARRTYGIALKRRPTLSHAELGLGHIAYDEGEYSTAEVHYRRAHQFYPDNPDYLENLASAQRLAGKHGEAVEHFLRVVNLDPDRLSPIAELCITLRAQGRFRDSYRVLMKTRTASDSAKQIDELFSRENGKNDSTWLFIIGDTRETLSERDEKLAFLDVSAALSAALEDEHDKARTLVRKWAAKPRIRQAVDALVVAEIAFLQRQFPEAREKLDEFRELFLTVSATQ